MTYEEALSYIHSTDWRGSRPGLSRVTELLEKLGNPQDSLKFIHVGGTNGKGSFCAMLSSVLCESGLKTGLFTSPYIEDFNERMMINGQPISNSLLADLTEKVRRVADKMLDGPTEFELITAVAMLYFVKENCDIVVLEVGLGGRLDATNVIKNPVLSVISGISLDHTAILGDTVGKIAAEKAGIIKKDCPTLLGCASAEKDREEIRKVISFYAKEQNSEFFETDLSLLSVKNISSDGSIFDFGAYKNIRIGLLGLYQVQNAANVLCAVDILKKYGFSITNEALRNGLLKSSWKARFEKLSENPLIFFDGSHNPQGVSETLKSLKCYFGASKAIILTGVMADKDYSEMVSMISETAYEVFTLTPNNPRALAASDLAELYRSFGVKATSCDSITDAVNIAVDTAKENGHILLALGSLYMYGDVKKAIISKEQRG